jgi:hypothetical protein
MSLASMMISGDSVGMSVLTSVITPFCQRKPRQLPLASHDWPRIWPRSLIAHAKLEASPWSGINDLDVAVGGYGEDFCLFSSSDNLLCSAS